MDRKKYQRPKGLPRDFLVQIVKGLADKGIQVNKERIRNTLRGRNNDIDLTKAIALQIQKIRLQHKKEMKELKKIRARVKKG